MATSQQFLVCDSSTLANFKQWAQAISAWIGSCGFFAQASDSGQVNWSTIAAVPGSGATVYEIWKSNDGLTQFYMKVEYGNYTSQTNCPNLRITLSTSTDGAGNCTGYVTTRFFTNNSSFTPPSTTTQYECDFSGGAGYMGVMMWRNGTGNCQQMFAVERSIDSSGAYTSEYVTIYVAGLFSGTGNANGQQTLHFAAGAAPPSPDGALVLGGWYARGFVASTAFNGSIAIDTCAPMIGSFGFPGTIAGLAWGADFVEGVTFTVSLYGSTRTYMPSKNGPFGTCTNTTGRTGNPTNFAMLMRYD